MISKVERYRELGTLIRAAQAELDARQVSLIEAQQRAFDRTELDVYLTDLEQRIAAWKREKESVFRYLAGKEEGALMSFEDRYSILGRLKAEGVARTQAPRNGDSGSFSQNCLIRQACDDELPTYR